MSFAHTSHLTQIERLQAELQASAQSTQYKLNDVKEKALSVETTALAKLKEQLSDIQKLQIENKQLSEIIKHLECERPVRTKLSSKWQAKCST